MHKLISATALAVALGFGGVAAFAGPASAGKPDLGNATGNVTCQITAKVKITATPNLRSLDAYSHQHFPGFPLTTPDVYRAKLFIDEPKKSP